MTKFGNTLVSTSGRSFGSKLETAVFQVIKFRERANEIRFLQQQDRIALTAAEIAYIPDFKCEDLKTGEIFWIEAKGFETPEWRIKRRLWQHYGPGKLEIWMGDWRKPFLKETIIPKGK